MISPIRYRGHGRYEAYYPGLSIAGVMGHELVHMASYRRRAAQEGRLVLQSGVRLHLAFRGGRMVATGGEAYMRTRPLRPAAAATPPAQPGPARGGEPADASAPAPSSPGPGTAPDPDPAAVEARLRRERQRIEQLLRRLQAPAPLAGGQPGAPGAPGQEARASEPLRRLERVAILLQLAEQMPASEATQQALLALARRAYGAAIAVGGRQGSILEAAA